MSRLSWALNGVLAGGLVGGLIAFVQFQDLGRVTRFPIVVAVGVAVSVLYWADSAGKMKEPDQPPSLSLHSYPTPPRGESSEHGGKKA